MTGIRQNDSVPSQMRGGLGNHPTASQALWSLAELDLYTEAAFDHVGQLDQL